MEGREKEQPPVLVGNRYVHSCPLKASRPGPARGRADKGRKEEGKEGEQVGESGPHIHCSRVELLASIPVPPLCSLHRPFSFPTPLHCPPSLTFSSFWSTTAMMLTSCGCCG